MQASDDAALIELVIKDRPGIWTAAICRLARYRSFERDYRSHEAGLQALGGTPEQMSLMLTS